MCVAVPAVSSWNPYVWVGEEGFPTLQPHLKNRHLKFKDGAQVPKANVLIQSQTRLPLKSPPRPIEGCSIGMNKQIEDCSFLVIPTVAEPVPRPPLVGPSDISSAIASHCPIRSTETDATPIL